jgi:hypothetical protein
MYSCNNVSMKTGDINGPRFPEYSQTPDGAEPLTNDELLKLDHPSQDRPFFDSSAEARARGIRAAEALIAAVNLADGSLHEPPSDDTRELYWPLSHE